MTARAEDNERWERPKRSEIRSGLINNYKETTLIMPEADAEAVEDNAGGGGAAAVDAAAAAEDTTATAAAAADGDGGERRSPPRRSSSWRQAQAESDATLSVEMLADMERRFTVVEKERDEALAELEKRRDELTKAQQTISDRNELEIKSKETQHQLTLSNQNVASLQEELKAVQERSDRMQAEKDQLGDEISKLKESNAELTKTAADYETSSKLKESQAIPLFHENQRLQTELDSLKAHADWIMKEFDAKSRDYTKLQQESRDHKVQLQLQLDQTLNDKEAAGARLEALGKIEHALQDKVNLLSHDVLTLKQELTTLNETTEAKILAEQKVVEMQKKHIERLNQKHDDVVKENEALKKQAELAMQQAEKEKQDALKELEGKYNVQIEELSAEFEDKLRRAPTSAAKARSPALPIAAAGAADSMEVEGQEEREPLNLTDLYARLEQTKAELRKEQKQRKRVEELFQQTRRQIEATAPKLLRQREEYDIAMNRIEDYDKRLTEALTERNHAREDTREARQEAASWKNQCSERTREARELSKQVQALLVSKAGGQVAADIPTSVSEMQSQNQRLLVEHGRLKDKVSELEGRLQSDTLRLQLDAKSKDLLVLREDKKKQDTLVDQIVHQRDLYRALLMKHDSNLLGSENEELTALEMAKQQSERAKNLEQKNRSLEGDLAAARSETTTVTRAKDEMSERLARYEVHNGQLTDAVNKLERDILSARSDVARAEADSQYHRERSQRNDEALERAREEVRQVTRSKSELESMMSSMQQALSKAHADTASKQSETQQAIMKLRLAETQLQAAKSAEGRLTEENNRLRADVATRGSSIDSIRRIEAAVAANAESEKEVMKKEIERLTKELDQVKSKDSTEAETLNSRIRNLESRIEGLQSSKTKSDSDALAAKKALLEAKTESQSLSSKYSLLESQLRLAKNKLGETEGDEDAEATMETKIESLSSELAAVRDENKSLLEQVGNYQKIAKESETSLLDLRSASDELKASQEKETEDLKKRIESMKKESETKNDVIKELTDDLASQRGEQQKREAELEKQIALLKAEIESNDKDTESSREEAATMKVDLEKLRSDLESSRKNYERELELHAEARKSLRTAREKADEETRQRNQALEKLEGVKQEIAQQQLAWEQEKIASKESMMELEKSLNESRENNKDLHTQIKSLADMVEKNQASRVEAAAESPAAEEMGDIQKAHSELQTLLKVLSSENEMIQAQLENVTRDGERERASAQVLKRSLDEARAELQNLQSQGDAQSEGARQVDALKEQVQSLEAQAKLLNDSNKLLREETEKFQKLHDSALKELDAAKKLAEPAQKVQRELEVKIASLEAEKASLNRDLEDWKNRVKSLVSKFNQIDPVEHQQLKDKVEEMEKEKESMTAWKRTTEQENTRIRNIAKTLKQKNTLLVAASDKQKKDIERLSAANKKSVTESKAATERDELKQKVAQMEKEMASKKAELAGKTTQTDRLRDMLRQFQSNIKDLRSKEQKLSEENKSLKAKNSELEAKLAKGQTEGERPKEPKDSISAKAEEAKPTTGSTTIATTKTAPVDETSKQQNVPTKSTTKTPEAGGAEEAVPSVPEGGFKFGPSETSTEQTFVQKGESNKSLEVKKASAPPSLRAAAKPFSPSSTTSTKTEPAKKEEAQSAPSSAEQVPPATRGVARRPSSGSKAKEMSMKEKLLEKKRKLAEKLAQKKVKEAKQDEETIDAGGEVKEGSEEAGQEKPAKRTKMATDSLPSSPVPPEASTPEQSTQEQPAKRTKMTKDGSSSPVPAEMKPEGSNAEASKEVSSAEAAPVSGAEGVKGAILAKPDEGAVKHAEPEGKEDTHAEEAVEEGGEEKETDAGHTDKKETPFGAHQTTHPNPFAAAAASSSSQPVWGAAASSTTFGQSLTTAPASVAKPTSPASRSSSGAFLNMKPPGSSATPPTFAFGNSGSITLPVPSALAPSPFGAFGASTFGSVSSGGARPLFGAPQQAAPPPAAAPGATATDTGDEEEKMDDGEGADMDAET